MSRIKNLFIPKILGLAAAFMLAFSIAAIAQDNDQSQQSNQGQSSSTQDQSFGNDAQNFANRLGQQLGLTTGQADKITQILIDYRDNIAQARQDFLKKNPASANNTRNSNAGDRDVTGSQTGGNRDVNASDIDANPDLMSDYRKADQKADKAIVDVMDNDSQKAQYVKVKRQWWDDVKNKVYSSVKQSMGDMNSGQQNQ